MITTVSQHCIVYIILCLGASRQYCVLGWLHCCNQVTSRLQGAQSHGVDVNGSLSVAVQEMKQALNARILNLELHVSYPWNFLFVVVLECFI